MDSQPQPSPDHKDSHTFDASFHVGVAGDSEFPEANSPNNFQKASSAHPHFLPGELLKAAKSTASTTASVLAMS